MNSVKSKVGIFRCEDIDGGIIFWGKAWHCVDRRVERPVFEKVQIPVLNTIRDTLQMTLLISNSIQM
jgi:hypothetical protein